MLKLDNIFWTDLSEDNSYTFDTINKRILWFHNGFNNFQQEFNYEIKTFNNETFLIKTKAFGSLGNNNDEYFIQIKESSNQLIIGDLILTPH